MKDTTRLKGTISADVTDQIKAAVKAAVTLDPHIQQIILAALP